MESDREHNGLCVCWLQVTAGVGLLWLLDNDHGLLLECEQRWDERLEIYRENVWVNVKYLLTTVLHNFTAIQIRNTRNVTKIYTYYMLYLIVYIMHIL